jgi:hypothetical protein
MNILNNSTIDTVIDFANVKFGMELTKEQVVSQLKGLSFSETLKLLSAMKSEDGDKFSEIIDLSSVSEGYHIMPDIDREKYQERDGLEGPFQTKSGKVVYYDPKEGSYYDPDTDIYISYDEWRALDEAGYGTIKTMQATASSVKSDTTKQSNAQRRANISNQDANRDSTRSNRTVAGSNKQATGQGASRMPTNADPDDVQRDQNAQGIAQNSNQSAYNAQEIERLKKAAGIA